jgi:hypothetical protein
MEIRFDVEYQAYFVGFILRASADNSSNYTWIPSDHTLGIWNLYKRLSGSYTQIGSVSISGSTLGTIGAGSKLSLRARIQSSTIYFKIWNFGLTEPSSWTGQVSDSSVTAPGYFGFYNNSSGGGNATIDNITLDNLVVSVATDFTLAPPSQSTIVGIASGAYAVTPNGTPSAATTIALADGGAGGMFTPSSLVFTSATAQTFTYTPTTAGTKTLTATASGGFSVTHTANCVASNSVATDFALSPSSRSTGVGSATGAYGRVPGRGVGPGGSEAARVARLSTWRCSERAA